MLTYSQSQQQQQKQHRQPRSMPSGLGCPAHQNRLVLQVGVGATASQEPPAEKAVVQALLCAGSCPSPT